MKPSITSKNIARRGQSIIEALIAISILTVGLLGIMTLLTKSFQLNRTVSDSTTATYLAAENIEVVKNLIDHDVYVALANGPGGWGTCFNFTGNYYVKVDYTTNDCAAISASLSASTTTYPIYFTPFAPSDPSTGLYGYTQYSNSKKTIFTRSTLVLNTDANEIDVESTVYWSSSPGNNQSVTLEDHFYNWQP